MRIVEGDIDDPKVAALVRTHVSRALAETARGSGHALDTGGLKAPRVRFFSIWDNDRVLGIGALKSLSSEHGEIKSMHTAEAARGRGVGSAMLRHILRAAKDTGLSRVSLETGSWDYFAPARAFYRRHGFIPCEPFGGYKPDPNSVFLTLLLKPEIRAYGEADFERVTTIWLESWKSTGVAAPVTLEELRTRWREELTKGWRIHVATLGQEIVGFVGLNPGKLEQLFVAPEHQSKGIGKVLLDFVKAQLPDGFELSTALHTRAPSFYEREKLTRGETGIHPRLGHEIVTYYWQPGSEG